MGILITDITMYILPFLFVNFVITIVSLPLTSLIFNKLSDRGFSLASIIGWFSISYIVFTLSTVAHMQLGYITILIVFVIWTVLNIVIALKQKTFVKTINFKQIAKIQVALVAFMALFYFFKSRMPEIYQIERFMDFGIIKSLTNAKTLPLFDNWMLGTNLNYYYFGQFVAYIMLTLSKIDVIPGFFLLSCYIFSTLAINAYRIGKDLYLNIAATTNKKLSNVAGALTLFFAVFAGNLHPLYWLYKGTLLTSFYPEPTRFLGNTITELPIYSFIVGDLHAYVWGLLIAVIIVSTFLCFWFDKSYSNRLALTNKYLLVATFFFGIAYMTNSWDVLTLGSLFIFGCVIKYFYDIKAIITSLLKLNLSKATFYKTITPLSLGIALFVVAAPFLAFFASPVGGIGKTYTTTPLWKLFIFWGGFLLLLTPFLIRNTIQFEKNKLIFSLKKELSYIYVFLIIIAGFILFTEVFYFKDILTGYKYYNANTFFKIYNIVWFLAASITGAIVTTYLTSKKRILTLLFVGTIIGIQLIYPLKSLYQAEYAGRKYTGLNSSLDWFKTSYPYDYEAYDYLEYVRLNLTDTKIKNIVEAAGNSYEDDNFYSTFLGWPTIIGWQVHEWTHLGSYAEVGKRVAEVSEIYTGKSLDTAKALLVKYNINYIIIGSAEKRIYKKGINTAKLESLGNIVFQNREVTIIEVSRNL